MSRRWKELVFAADAVVVLVVVVGAAETDAEAASVLGISGSPPLLFLELRLGPAPRLRFDLI